jgi:hypothetical protein
MLRRQAIIHRNHQAPGQIRQTTAKRVLRVKIANLPAPGVKKDQYREGAATFWSIDPDRDFSRWTRDQTVLDLANRLWFTPHS